MAAAAQSSASDKPQETQTWLFLNPDEVQILTAMVDRIIPADDLGPGAVVADVPVFIDRQLAGAWGGGLQLYRQGPFMPGTPQQGYQLPMTPAEMFRHCLSLAGKRCKEVNSQELSACSAPQQDGFMQALSDGKVDLSPIPSATFFNQLVETVMEGFFSDPMYGGNKDMVGWKLVGFPGAYASYNQEIERHSLAWNREPISIAQHDDVMHDMGHAQ